MAAPYTCRDVEVLTYMSDVHERLGRMPTLKEIIYDVKISRGQLRRNIQNLERKGYIRRLPAGTLRAEFVKQ